MPTLNKIQQVTLIALQQYPDIYARFNAGDRRITAPIMAMQHMLAELGRDVDVSEIEPFVKSREATILADASNKGILPLGTPCQHKVLIENKGTQRCTISSGRVFEDGQGRPWRFLQNAEIQAGESIEVLAEQSQVREVKKTIIESIPFNQFSLPIEDDMSLVSMHVKDQDDNVYSFKTRWMNTLAGDYAITLKTNSLREIILEFGDSERFGRTLQANTTLTINLIETYGEVEVTALKEATLQQINNSNESKLKFKFKTDGLIRMGANPLSINQMRLLASYPAYDDNSVFLGNFNFTVRKNFMTRTHFINVWNEAIHEQHFAASYENINHLFVSFVPKNNGEKALMQDEIAQLIARMDNLYSNGRTKFIQHEERPFKIFISANLSPVHDDQAVKEQIKALLLSNYGKEQIASSYYQSNGFNTQEISKLINKNIAAFQDRQSDFKIAIEDLNANKIKPNQWLFISESSITFDIKRSSGEGEGLWAIL